MSNDELRSAVIQHFVQKPKTVENNSDSTEEVNEVVGTKHPEWDSMALLEKVLDKKDQSLVSKTDGCKLDVARKKLSENVRLDIIKDLM